jgi:hypothetical protein
MMIRILYLLILTAILTITSYAQDEPSALGDNYGCIVVGIGNFFPSTGTGGLTFHGGFYRQNFSRLLLGG